MKYLLILLLAGCTTTLNVTPQRQNQEQTSSQTASTAAAPVIPNMTFEFNVDAKSGAVSKTVTLEKDEKGNVTGAKVVEDGAKE